MDAFREEVNGHRVEYERMEKRPSGKSWSVDIRCRSRGWFLDYAPTLDDARTLARDILTRWGRQDF